MDFDFWVIEHTLKRERERKKKKTFSQAKNSCANFVKCQCSSVQKNHYFWRQKRRPQSKQFWFFMPRRNILINNNKRWKYKCSFASASAVFITFTSKVYPYFAKTVKKKSFLFVFISMCVGLVTFEMRKAKIANFFCATQMFHLLFGAWIPNRDDFWHF